ncbi:metalloregulator ArsR/SmtB family transcription factor [Ancylobacter sp. 6x-1]|uniref:Metalloregulator ArsR/SmtB family transcription factor n=1 Tax=Ancylobacter crimeensis TaxID=2579147 RepID=A0ABT0D877_9HYPH|nr:metalloregulator ArsR/SmtB family transcription factor [Ancylobacter crimeensis]MCK0196154.1 metalloregulator ArsR/SmtB family transcription factor [Ancylobacter crimeensis]
MTATPETTDEHLATCLRALGHPVRLVILRALARADRCQCGDIVRGLTLAQSTVSQHLKVLKDAGLIRGEIEGPRSCYCLDRAAMDRLARTLGPLLADLSAPAFSSPASPSPAPQSLADACQPRSGLNASPAAPICEAHFSSPTPLSMPAGAQVAMPARSGHGAAQSTDNP